MALLLPFPARLPKLHSLRFLYRSKPGAEPGTLAAVPGAPTPRISVLAYDKSGCVEHEDITTDQLFSLPVTGKILWVNVAGLGSGELLKELRGHYGLHELPMEDVVHLGQPAKAEQYDDWVFVIHRMAEWVGRLSTEQISIFFSRRVVITFQEKPGDCLEPVRNRIRRGRGRIRKQGADYLAYAVMDAIVDSYFPVVQKLSEDLQELEEEIFARSQGDVVGRIYAIRRSLATLRRAVWPHRDAIAHLRTLDSTLLHDETRLHLRDCSDHVVQILGLLETYSEVVTSLLDIHLNIQNTRMNERIQLLTVVSTIFIPLTFVAGVYGMNFNTDASVWNMPELNWAYGYPFALGLMATMAGGMLIYFRRRRWL